MIWGTYATLMLAGLTAAMGALSALLTGVWVIAQSSARLRDHGGRISELERAHEQRWETLTNTIAQLREELAALRATMEALRHDDTRFAPGFQRHVPPLHRSGWAETSDKGAQEATL
jgi:hypothetical protein